jgi:alpha-1,3-glucosyltransferase
MQEKKESTPTGEPVTTPSSSSVWDVLPVVAFLTGLKLACFPLYRSTDFEVHRNWMAVTHSLPVDRWYVDATSEWTLDYPPLFAWFEYALSFAAKACDPEMVRVDNLNYASWETVYFMRATVIVSDLVFAVASWVTATAVLPDLAGDKGRMSVVLAFAMLFGDVNLFMVDHLHFQYNG